MNDLDVPLPLPEAAAKARALGVQISDWSCYRLAREGVLPVSRHGRARTTVRAIVEALAPTCLRAGGGAR